MQNLSEIDYTLLVMEQLYPSEPKPTMADKGIDILKILTCTTIPGMIGQVLETGIKTFQSIQNSKYKYRTLKYVSNMYEVQKFSEIEMKRLEIESKKNETVNLFIDKAFQSKIDEISKIYNYNMNKLKNEHDAAIHRVNAYAEIELKRIDKQYAAIIKEQELKCVMYRQFLQHMYINNITPADLIGEASNLYFQIVMKAYDKGDGDSSSTQSLFNSIIEYIRFIGDPYRFVSFHDYLKRTNMFEGDRENAI